MNWLFGVAQGDAGSRLPISQTIQTSRSCQFTFSIELAQAEAKVDVTNFLLRHSVYTRKQIV